MGIEVPLNQWQTRICALDAPLLLSIVGAKRKNTWVRMVDSGAEFYLSPLYLLEIDFVLANPFCRGKGSGFTGRCVLLPLPSR